LIRALMEAAVQRKGGNDDIRRVVSNIASVDPATRRTFYVDVLGFEVAMDMGWIVTFAAPGNPSARMSLVRSHDSGTPHPDFTVEVDDVDACHARALAQEFAVVYPLTDEPWGIRRSSYAIQTAGLPT
jgi:catechol 2,3-dioxygenase-like lactoylglutathione lyase family enzyme